MDIIPTLVKIAEKEDVVDCNLEDLKRGEGVGYLGNISMVNLRGRTKCGQNKQLGFVIKAAATNEKLRQNGVIQVFAREIRVYKSILPAFCDFEKQRGIQNPFPIVPKCHYVIDTKPEMIILENLSLQGFCSWNRKLQMGHEHVELALRSFGRFHAISFAMRDQNPALFERLAKGLDNMYDKYMKLSGVFYAFIKKSKLALSAINPDSKVFTRYEKFLNGIEQKFDDIINCPSKHDIILHGDGWMNNMLFKYKENSTEPADMKFVDFQFSRLGSPICDVVYFLYPCTSPEILENMAHYKDVYYNSLSNHIRRLGTNPDVVYPLSAFEEDWKDFAKFGLIACGLINFTFLSEDNEILDLADVVESGSEIAAAFDYDIANMDEFNKRMKRIIEYFVDNDLI